MCDITVTGHRFATCPPGETSDEPMRLSCRRAEPSAAVIGKRAAERWFLATVRRRTGNMCLRRAEEGRSSEAYQD